MKKDDRLVREAARKRLAEGTTEKRSRVYGSEGEPTDERSRARTARTKATLSKSDQVGYLTKIRLKGTDQGNSWELWEESDGSLLSTHDSRESAKKAQVKHWREYVSSH